MAKKTKKQNKKVKSETLMPTPHNRQKKHILTEGTPIPPLVDMGVFTQDGKVAAPMQHKYRQINRFLEMIDDTLEDIQSLSVVDFGCGKSYLTFVLYYFLTEIKGIDTKMVGLDLKADVIADCQTVAEKYGYHGLRFMHGDIGEFAAKQQINADSSPLMIISLHACDTATDYALYHAIKMGAQMIFAAPCCQHELKSQIEADNLSLLTRYGAVKERTAALMTDAIRTNLVASQGYKTQLMEFVDLAHTPKNLLIRAVKTKMPVKARHMYLQEVEALCQTFNLKPLLGELLNWSKISTS